MFQSCRSITFTNGNDIVDIFLPVFKNLFSSDFLDNQFRLVYRNRSIPRPLPLTCYYRGTG